MNNAREYLNKSRLFKCTYCDADIEVKNLADHMKYEISEDMGGETGIEYKFSFVENVDVKCPKCFKKFRIKGCLWYAPDEDFKHGKFELMPFEG